LSSPQLVGPTDDLPWALTLDERKIYSVEHQWSVVRWEWVHGKIKEHFQVKKQSRLEKKN